jgi:hypothetical protein
MDHTRIGKVKGHGINDQCQSRQASHVGVCGISSTSSSDLPPNERVTTIVGLRRTSGVVILDRR